MELACTLCAETDPRYYVGQGVGRPIHPRNTHWLHLPIYSPQSSHHTQSLLADLYRDLCITGGFGIPKTTHVCLETFTNITTLHTPSTFL